MISRPPPSACSDPIPTGSPSLPPCPPGSGGEPSTEAEHEPFFAWGDLNVPPPPLAVRADRVKLNGRYPRGRETINDKIFERLPSGELEFWGWVEDIDATYRNDKAVTKRAIRNRVSFLNLSPAQTNVLCYIVSHSHFKEPWAYIPLKGQDEWAEAIGISTRTLQRSLTTLEDSEYIFRTARRSRALRKRTPAAKLHVLTPSLFKLLNQELRGGRRGGTKTPY